MEEVVMYTVYKITNKVNGKFYIGVHKTDNPMDSYMGSGMAIKCALSKYGRDCFTKEILHIFDTAEEAFVTEREILNEVWHVEVTYNMKPGGLGGWDVWNVSKNPDHNPMKRPDVVERNKASKAKTIEANREKYAEISRQNLQKAVEANTGKKRPDHSKFMAEQSKQMWAQDKEKIRDALSSWFCVISPDGVEYRTNRLEEFCAEHILVYVSVWNSSRTGKPVSKGKSKGWICKKEQ